jgi:hypothetical protein
MIRRLSAVLLCLVIATPATAAEPRSSHRGGAWRGKARSGKARLGVAWVPMAHMMMTPRRRDRGRRGRGVLQAKEDEVMGRGLSELQKTILLRALSNREREFGLEHPTPADIYATEIAADYFGWKYMKDMYEIEHTLEGYPCRCRWGLRRHNRRPRGMSTTEAHRVQASIWRALRRLEERGLGEVMQFMFHRGTGLKLSDEGIAVAKRLRLSVDLFST